MPMKWILIVSAFTWWDPDPMLFATHEQCMAAAAEFVKTNRGYVWVDRPQGFGDFDYLVMRTVECSPADPADAVGPPYRFAPTPDESKS